MKRYSAVCLDLFGTVVEFDVRRLPEIILRGEPVRSTIGVAHDILSEDCPDLRLEELAEAWEAATDSINAIKARDLREINAEDRFARVLEKCRIGNGADSKRLATKMTEAHMNCLMNATVLPEDHLFLLRRLRGRFRLGLVSNFDHDPTGRAILRRLGLDEFFEAVVLSDAIGYRKPHASLFLAALEALNVSARETLFVGDTPEADISGPNALGIDVAWIDGGNVLLPENVPAPEYRIRSLVDIERILSAGQ